MTIEKFPLNYRGKYIQGYRCGSGSDVIVLLHGSGVYNAMLSWKEVMLRLGKKATVYALDLPGYGNSDPLDELPEEGFYPYYHHCLEAVLDQMKLERFVLVGLSMGGAVAIRYALEHPERVCGLVPVSSWGLSEKVPSHLLGSWFVNRTNFVTKLCHSLSKSETMTKMYIQTVHFGRKSSITPEIIKEVMDEMKKESTITSIRLFQKSSITPKAAIPYFGEELSKLKMPVLLIHGKRDPIIPRINAEKATRIISNGRLNVMLSCRHWCCKEQPEMFYQILWAFVKRDCLFSYKNQLPKTEISAEKATDIPQTSSEIVENPLHTQLRKRYEKRRRAATVQRLRSGNKNSKPSRARKALYKK